MPQDTPQRKLTTVLAADAVGYSRLMAADEPGTVARFKHLHDQVFQPLSQKHAGRIIKLMGDGLLMEFASVVDAVHFAVSAQSAITAANETQESIKQMPFRMGINIGDVLSDGEDIHGNGVNVAARLEALAPPGGIYVSGTVHDHVRGKVPFHFTDLGDQQVKNIPDPIRVFAISETHSTSSAPTRQQLNKTLRSKLLIPLAAAVGLAIASYLWLPSQSAAPEDIANADALAFPLPDKPSIAVLPFEALSDLESENHIARGVTADLTTDLSKVSGLFVIAQNATQALKDGQLGTGTIAERLGVRYILLGSVRQAGDALRVNTQLVDTATGAHIWAERFDGAVSDVFSMQDNIVVTTVDALRLTLTDAEKTELSRVETDQIDAKTAFQQGWDLVSRFNATDNASAVPHFQEAIRLDPNYGRAYGALALVYLRGSAFGWDEALGEQEATLRHTLAPQYLREAEKHGTTLVHVVRAMQNLFYRHTSDPIDRTRRTDTAKREASAAIAVQPSDPEAHVMMAWAMIASGEAADGLNFLSAAKRLNPNPPSHYAFFEATGHFARGNLETAAAVLRTGLDQNPDATELLPIAASMHALLGLRQEAAAMINRWQPEATPEAMEAIIEHYAFPMTWTIENNWLNTRLTDGLRLAAVPVEMTVTSLIDLAAQGPIVERVAHIRTLGWVGPPAAPAVPILRAALSDPERRIRREAAITLGKIGPASQSALEALETLKEEPIVGFHAQTAIERITAQP